MGTEYLHAKSGHIYIIGALFRKGALTFATSLEYDYYPPDTEQNELYNIFQLQYCGMPYYIIEIPQTESSFNIVQKLAKHNGLILVNGKPASANLNDKPFGLLCNAEQCFTLETIHDKDAGSGSWMQQLKDEQESVRQRLKITQTDICNEQEGH